MAICFVVAVGGCLVPMPIEERLPEENLPPFYLSDFTSPPAGQVVEFDPEIDSVIEFNTGPIDDPNTDDRLFWRWFVDYRRVAFNIPIEFSEANGATPSQLSSGLNKVINPCTAPTFNLLSDEDVHRVELIVADRPFIASSGDDPRPNQMLSDEALFFRIVWFVRFDQLC